MRIFQDCHEMHNEVKRDLHEMGTIVHPETMQDKDVRDDSDFQTLELSPCVFTLISGSDRNQWIMDLGLSLNWCLQDISERLSSAALSGTIVNPGSAWSLREDIWDEFRDVDGKFAYTYSERLGLFDMLNEVIKNLRNNPNTRHGILPVYNTQLDTPNLDGRRRIPCSMYYQFMLRNEQLHGIYTMRSTDFITHFPYDIWMGLELQTFLAEKLGVPEGCFTFFTGSLHIYAKDADAGVF